jgi:hypothetical protein
VPPEKADRVVAALRQRLVLRRIGMFESQRPHVIEGGVRQ